MQATLEVSERRACRAIEQARSTQRYQRVVVDDEERLTQEIVRLASKFGRYGYRRVTGLLRNDGWEVNHKRVERIWRAEGLKVPQRQPKRGRLWLNDGSCIRLRAEYPRHVWSYDFVADRTHDGRAFRTLNIIDEFTRECLAIRVGRSLKTEDVQACLTELFCSRGIPVHLRSDNGSEFANRKIRTWLSELGAKTLFIEPGSPWENGYIESWSTASSFTPWVNWTRSCVPISSTFRRHYQSGSVRSLERLRSGGANPGGVSQPSSWWVVGRFYSRTHCLISSMVKASWQMIPFNRLRGVYGNYRYFRTTIEKTKRGFKARSPKAGLQGSSDSFYAESARRGR